MHNFYDRRSPESLLREWARTGRNVDSFYFDIDDAHDARFSGRKARQILLDFLEFHECEVTPCEREYILDWIRYYARRAVTFALAAVGDRAVY
jgi:hypothetical protein